MSTDSGKRITYKRARPNPLIQEWLEELHAEAKEKNSHCEPMLRKALDSISKYPLPLKTGAECAILEGFEKKLCIFIDKRLEVYNYNLALAQSSETKSSSSSQSGRNTNCSSPMSDINLNIDNISTKSQNIQAKTNLNISQSDENLASCSKTCSQQNLYAHNIDTNSQNVQSKTVINSAEATNHNTDSQETVISKSNSTASSQSSSTNGKRRQRDRKYKPGHRTGAYAILIALLENSQHPGDTALSKEELIEKAQKHSEESFVRPKPESYYTAWSSMSQLVTKGLINKVKSKKVKYQLSDKGLTLAKELLEDSKNMPTVNDMIFNDLPTNSSNTNRVVTTVNDQAISTSQNGCDTVIKMPPDSFDIILLIDKNETGGVSKKNDPTVAQFNKYPDLKHEYRSLKVGDFTWIARHKVNQDQELVLPYVIERKRMDDLGASIKDGRFYEQKFRLRKCGLKNVVYLVENYGSNKNVGLPLQSLKQALANTRVQDGFKIHTTDSLSNSARYLAMMTKRLTIRYKDKDLKGCSDDKDDCLMTFDYFNKASAKTKALTVTEMFIKLLLQLKGVSVEKALAITAKYATPRSLIIAYQKCDIAEGEMLLANIKYGELSRNVGPTVSKAVYQLFSSKGSD